MLKFDKANSDISSEISFFVDKKFIVCKLIIVFNNECFLFAHAYSAPFCLKTAPRLWLLKSNLAQNKEFFTLF